MSMLDDIRAAYDKILERGPILIREDTLIFATLDCLALHGDKIEELERMTGKDVFWSEMLDDGDDERVLILNPPEFKFPEPVFKDPDRLLDRFFCIGRMADCLAPIAPITITKVDCI